MRNFRKAAASAGASAATTTTIRHVHKVKVVFPKEPSRKDLPILQRQNYQQLDFKIVAYFAILFISEFLPFLETESNGILHHLSKGLKSVLER